jgi:hypothetical protein
MNHTLGCIFGLIVTVTPWLFLWWLTSRMSSAQGVDEETTIEDLILRGGKKR